MKGRIPEVRCSRKGPFRDELWARAEKLEEGGLDKAMTHREMGWMSIANFSYTRQPKPHLPFYDQATALLLG